MQVRPRNLDKSALASVDWMSLASAVSKVGSMQENKTNLPGIDIL